MRPRERVFIGMASFTQEIYRSSTDVGQTLPAVRWPWRRLRRRLATALFVACLMQQISYSKAIQFQPVDFAVRENLPADSCVFNFTTPNGDDLPPDSFCTLTSESTGDLLTDNERRCLKVARGGLDFERKSTYDMRVSCGLFTYRLLVDVVDVNDNKPSFAVEQVNVTVPENTPAGAHILTVVATDHDQGTNSIRSYTIQPTDPSSVSERKELARTFQIEYSDQPKQARLHIARKLDREERREYVFVIFAVDGGGKSGAQRIRIVVGDVNDTPPKFAKRSYSASVRETATLYSPVLEVDAHDQDESNNASLIFSLLSRDKSVSTTADDWQHLLLSIHAGGLVSTNYYPLPIGRHEFWLKVSDGLFEDTVPLIVEVTDVNDHIPIIKRLCSHSRVELEEPSAHLIGKAVCQFDIEDGDLGKNSLLNISLIAGGGTFALDTTKLTVRPSPVRVSIKLVKGLDYETRNVYNLALIAMDNGRPHQMNLKEFTVHVMDSNEYAPTFQQRKYTFHVSQAAQPGELVARLRAYDRDGTDNSIRYSIGRWVPKTAKHWFTMDIETGLLKIGSNQSLLTWEEGDYVSLVVEAANAGTRNRQPVEVVSTVTVDIQILPENDSHHLKFSRRTYTATVVEGAIVSTSVVQLVVHSMYAEDSKLKFQLRVKHSNTSLPFVIDDQGVIRVARGKLLDRETVSKYELIATVSDQTLPPVSSTASVLIDILDINDNLPVFYPRLYRCLLIRSAKIGTVCTILSASDPDSGQAGEINYKIMDGDSSQLFALNATSGLLKLNSLIPPNHLPVYTLTAQARDGDGKKALQPASVLVSIVNTQDMMPVFSRKQYRFLLKEDVPVNSTIAPVNALSQLNQTDIKFTYAIVGGDPDGRFAILENGTLQVAKPLDREEQDEYSLIVEAVESIALEQYARTLVEIKLADVNDNPPRFPLDSVRIGMAECMPLNGIPVYTVHAEDADLAHNQKVTYHITGQGKDLFEINRQTGELVPRIPFDFEATKQVQLKVKALDLGSPRLGGLLNIIIDIQDCNDNPPVFREPSVTAELREDAEPSTIFLNVSATDADSGRNAATLFRLIGASTLPFGIQARTGDVYVNQALDYETKSSYDLTIVATNSALPHLSSTTSIRIKVLDINDMSPVFDKIVYKFAADELDLRTRLPKLPIFLGRVRAVDGDSGSNAVVRYRIGQNHTDFAKIDAVTGNITLTQHLDREAKPRYSLRILAVDQGLIARTGTCIVRITIRDANDNPPTLISPQPGKQAVVMLREDVDVGSFVYKVIARDRDTGQNGKIVYKWAYGIPQTDFNLNGNTGVISTRKRLDFETLSAYKLTVIASDQGKDWSRLASAVVTVMIVDVNDISPRFINSSDIHLNIPQSQMKPFTTVAHLVAKDPEPVANGNGQVRYSITGGSVEGHFTVDPTNGVLTVTDASNNLHALQTGNNYTLQVTASDTPGNGRSLSATYLLHIHIIPELLYFPIRSQTVQLSEETRAGHPIVQVYIEDRRSVESSVVSYHIQSVDGDGDHSQTNPRDHFAIDNKTGQVYLKSGLDYETAKHFTLELSGELGTDKLAVTSLLHVLVADTNDVAPVFPIDRHVEKIAENTRPGRTFYTARAEDRDSGIFGNVTYSFYRSPHGRLSQYTGPFMIDIHSGHIMLSRPLDYEVERSYSVIVQATDSPGIQPQNSAHLQLEINVTDVNDNHPKFGNTNCSGNISIRENMVPGTFICRLTATDEDDGLNGEIEYEMLGDDYNVFIIDPRSGILTTARILDREERDKYKVTLVARDKGRLSLHNQTRVVIHVLDENDNRPRFLSHYHRILVMENQRGPRSLKMLEVKDHDTGPNSELNFTITSGNIGDAFYMTDKGGYIVVDVQPLDREKVSQYNITVVVCDMPTNPEDKLCDSAAVKIIVKDVNDQTPQFTSLKDRKSVQEDAPLGFSVMQVTATDKDDGEYGRVHYRLDDLVRTFKINRTTGVITVASRLDYEKQKSYNLTVYAIDSAQHGPRSSAATVTVYVVDVNDVAPSFTRNHYVVNISEQIRIGGHVFKMVATDIDSGANAMVTYRLAKQSVYFDVNASTGTVFTEQILSRRLSPVFLTIIASDNGVPQLTGNASLQVNILDQSDSPPRFLQDIYTVPVYTNRYLPAYSGVTTMRAVSDQPRATLMYSLGKVLPQRANKSFTIMEITGEVRTLKRIPFHSQSTYRIEIIARDRHHLPTQPAKTILKLQWQPEQHTFLHFRPDSSYNFEISESHPVGSLVGTVEARSDFEHVRPSYKLVTETSFFRVLRHSGKIYTRMPLDFELNSTYVLSVLATDRTNLSQPSIATVNVRVINENDNRPYWSVHRRKPIKQPENLPVGHTVTTVLAADADLDPLQYSLSNRFENTFSISSYGEVVLNRPLDFETKDSYRLEVKATDGRSTITTNIILLVEDVNDNAPQFQAHVESLLVAELKPVGRPFAQVSAMDPDRGLNGSVRYYLQETTKDYFSIHPTTGEISLTRTLRYKKHGKNQYTIKVIASDRGTPPKRTPSKIMIQIFDVNDHTPQFAKSNYIFRIKEDMEVAGMVGRVSATDEDDTSNSRLTYNIVGGSDVFSLSSTTGEIYLRMPLDRELESIYQITVSVSDDGLPKKKARALVTFHVEDVNDNPPIFDKSLYVVAVTGMGQLLDSNRSLVQVRATDQDENGNSHIRYSIVGHHRYSSLVYIDRLTGEIFPDPARLRVVAEDLPLNEGFQIQVNASDQDWSAEVEVNIVVFSENRSLPVFTHSLYTASVWEDAPANQLVKKVTAVCPNKTGRSDVHYKIVRSANSEAHLYFKIDKDTGNIFVIGSRYKRLNYEEKTQYRFLVKAYETNNADQVSFANVTINVKNVNEGIPTFLQHHYDFTIHENAKMGDVIGRVLAIDVDKNDDLRYSFYRGERPRLYEIFDVDSLTGKITLTLPVGVTGRFLPMNGTVLVSDGYGEDSSIVTIRLEDTAGKDGGPSSTTAESKNSNEMTVTVVSVAIAVLVVVIGAILAARRLLHSKYTDMQPQSPSQAVTNNLQDTQNGDISCKNSRKVSFSTDASQSEETFGLNSRNINLANESLSNSTLRFHTPLRQSIDYAHSFGLSQNGSHNLYASSSPYVFLQQNVNTNGNKMNNAFGEDIPMDTYGESALAACSDLPTMLYAHLAEFEAEEHSKVMDGACCFGEEGSLQEDDHVEKLKICLLNSVCPEGDQQSIATTTDCDDEEDDEDISDLLSLCQDLVALPSPKMPPCVSATSSNSSSTYQLPSSRTVARNAPELRGCGIEQNSYSITQQMNNHSPLRIPAQANFQHPADNHFHLDKQQAPVERAMREGPDVEDSFDNQLAMFESHTPLSQSIISVVSSPATTPDDLQQERKDHQLGRAEREDALDDMLSFGGNETASEI